MELKPGVSGRKIKEISPLRWGEEVITGVRCDKEIMCQQWKVRGDRAREERKEYEDKDQSSVSEKRKGKSPY